MLRTLKNSLLICALLSSSFSLVAGWEDWMSPHIAIPAFSVGIVGIKVARYTYRQKKVQQSADKEATEYVTNILKKNNAIKNNETVSARWGDWYRACMDTCIEVPEEHARESPEFAEFAVLHEKGHIVNKDTKRSWILDTLIACSIFSSFFTQRLDVIAIIACSAFPLERLYSRHLERQADHFAINHIQNPDLLEAIAQIFSDAHIKNTPLPTLLWEAVMSDHPSLIERTYKKPLMSSAQSKKHLTHKSS